jgi:hypothetical protein
MFVYLYPGCHVLMSARSYKLKILNTEKKLDFLLNYVAEFHELFDFRV